METYIMATRLESSAATKPSELEKLEEGVVELIRSELPQVEWIESFAVMGPYDYIDIFKAPKNDDAQKVGIIVRTVGRASVEIWPASGWRCFTALIRKLPGEAGSSSQAGV